MSVILFYLPILSILYRYLWFLVRLLIADVSVCCFYIGNGICQGGA